MTTEKIIVNDTCEHSVEVKRLTLLCHRDDMRITVAGRVRIDPEATVARARSLTPEDWRELGECAPVTGLYNTVFTDGSGRNSSLPWPLNTGLASLAQLHVVGMLLLIAECLQDGKQPLLVLPETYLHPAQQTGIAQMLIRISTPTQEETP